MSMILRFIFGFRMERKAMWILARSYMEKCLNRSRIRLYSNGSSYTLNSTHYPGQTGLTLRQNFCTRRYRFQHNIGMHSGAAQTAAQRR